MVKLLTPITLAEKSRLVHNRCQANLRTQRIRGNHIRYRSKTGLSLRRVGLGNSNRAEFGGGERIRTAASKQKAERYQVIPGTQFLGNSTTCRTRLGTE